MVNVVIVKSNSIVYDIRVQKIARSLSKKYSTRVLGWNREGLKASNFSCCDVELLNLRAPFGRLSLALYLPIFWAWIFFRLIIYLPEVTHSCDLDTFMPCYLYARIFRRKLVFEVFDRYAMAYIPARYPMIYRLVNRLEEFSASHTDYFVTVSEKLLRSFKQKPRFSTIIMNCPEKSPLPNEKHTKDRLRLIYTGPIVQNRGLERITEAMERTENVELVIAGRIINKELFDEISKKSNVTYHGILEHSKALELEFMSDVMIILYDLNEEINKYAMPNKLFEAMMLGLPVISNVAAEIIGEINNGILVDYNDIDQIRRAIISCKNTGARETMKNAGRKAFLELYNWETMENRLLSMYESLVNEKLDYPRKTSR